MREISLGEVWYAVRERWLAIVVAAVLGLLVGAGTALLMTPVYRSEVLVAPAGEDATGGLAALGGQLGGLAALAGINIRTGTQSKDEAIALLRSRYLAESLIRDMELLPVIYADRWDVAKSTWRNADKAPTIWEALERFDTEIRSVNENPRTGLVTLAVDWSDPELARIWAEEIVGRANREMRSRTIREAESSLKYLDEQLQKARFVELEKAIYGLIESQTKRMMIASVREDYAFRIVDPASRPDPDEPIRPRPVAYTLLGLLAGFLTGLLYALLDVARTGFGADHRTVAAS